MIKLKKDNVSLLKGLIESDFLLVNKNLNKKFNININDSSNIKKSNLENQFLILFDYINNNSLLLKKLFDKNIYLVNKVNTKFEQNNWGTYKIFNELDDFKKFLFFIVLIELTLNKK
jgi:hypothetical protein